MKRSYDWVSDWNWTDHVELDATLACLEIHKQMVFDNLHEWKELNNGSLHSWLPASSSTDNNVGQNQMTDVEYANATSKSWSDNLASI